MTLRQFGAPARRRRRWPLIAAISAAVLFVLAGVTVVVYMATRSTGPGPSPAAAPAAITSATPAATTAGPTSTTKAAPRDPSGQEACDAIKPLAGTNAAGDATKMKEIGQIAAESSNSTIAIQGQLLADSADLALKARGQSDEAKRVASLKQYATRLDQACDRAGYR